MSDAEKILAESCENTRRFVENWLAGGGNPVYVKPAEDALKAPSCNPPQTLQHLDCNELQTCPQIEPEACEEGDGNVGISYFSSNNGKISYVSTTSKSNPTSPEKGPRITKICDPVDEYGNCPEGYVFKSLDTDKGKVNFCEEKPKCLHDWKYSAAFDICIPGCENPNEGYSVQKGRCVKWTPTPKPPTQSKNIPGLFVSCDTLRDILSIPSKSNIEIRLKGGVNFKGVSGEGEVKYNAEITREDWIRLYNNHCR